MWGLIRSAARMGPAEISSGRLTRNFMTSTAKLSVYGHSQGTAVTVFVRSAPQGFVGTSNIYLDDASLAALGQAPPTTTPPAHRPRTDFSVPTQEGTVTPVPTPLSPVPPVLTATPVLPDDLTARSFIRWSPGIRFGALPSASRARLTRLSQVNGLTNVGLINIGQTLVIPVKVTYTQPPHASPRRRPARTGGPGARRGAVYGGVRRHDVYHFAAL